MLVSTGCLRVPSADLTNRYLEVVRPGQRCGLVELSDVTLDSTFGYPVQEREGVAYSLANRRKLKVIKGNARVKVFFNKKHGKYVWKVWEKV